MNLRWWLWLSDDDDNDEFLLHLNVTFHVQCKMITTWEAAFTVTALEGLRACVFSIMSSEFVASCETPFASFPGALVGLFTCNLRRKKIEYFLHLERFFFGVTTTTGICCVTFFLNYGFNFVTIAKYFHLQKF